MSVSQEVVCGVQFYCQASEFLAISGSSKKLPVSSVSDLSSLKALPPNSVATDLTLFSNTNNSQSTSACVLVAAYCGLSLAFSSEPSPFGFRYVALRDGARGGRLILGTAAITQYLHLLALGCSVSSAAREILELVDSAALGPVSDLGKILLLLEDRAREIAAEPVLALALFPLLRDTISQSNLRESTPRLMAIEAGLAHSHVITNLPPLPTPSTSSSGSSSSPIGRAPTTNLGDESFDWAAAGLFSALKQLFTAGIRRAFPALAVAGREEADAVIARCANPTHGDFQCNSAMAIAKLFRQQQQQQGAISGGKMFISGFTVVTVTSMDKCGFYDCYVLCI
jgi:hypothetical protein